MTFNVVSSLVVDTVSELHYAIGQVALFVIGMVVSVCVGVWLLPYVYTYEDLLWYMVGMIVPLLPFMVGMERG